MKTYIHYGMHLCFDSNPKPYIFLRDQAPMTGQMLRKNSFRSFYKGILIQQTATGYMTL